MRCPDLIAAVVTRLLAGSARGDGPGDDVDEAIGVAIAEAVEERRSGGGRDLSAAASESDRLMARSIASEAAWMLAGRMAAAQQALAVEDEPAKVAEHPRPAPEEETRPDPRPEPYPKAAAVWPGLPPITAACLDRIVEETVMAVKSGLRRKLVGLCEGFYGRAIWLHVLKGKVLESICGYNTRMRDSWIPLKTTPSIIAYVAREGIGYVTGRAQDDPLYRRGLEETQSEMAVPLPGWPKVTGVVNCESPVEGAFTEGDLKDLAAGVGVVVPDLMVLDSLDRPPHLGKWSPWHPELWGPDLVPVLTRLCEAVKRDCDGDGRTDDVECAVWWVDAKNRRLAIYATSGYGQEYSRYSMSIPFESALGRSVERGLDDAIVVGPDCKDWLKTYKAESMGVRQVLVIPLHRKPDRKAGGTASALLTIYGFSESAERRLPAPGSPAARALARMFSAVIAGYDRMRPRVVAAQVRHALENRDAAENLAEGPSEGAEMARRRRDEAAPRPAPSGFDAFSTLDAAFSTLDVEARRDLQLVGFSVFPLDPTTGRYRAATDTVMAGDGPAEYDPEADRGSYTIFHSSNPDKVVIRNTPSDLGAEGFPGEPMNKHPERLSGPVLRHSRYMGYGLPDPGDPTRSVAVFKCVRSARQRPFTDGDARVLKRFAASAADLVIEWRKQRRDAETIPSPPAPLVAPHPSLLWSSAGNRGDVAPIAGGPSLPGLFLMPARLNSPPPSASRHFADETLDYLWLVTGECEPVRAGVILRRPYDPIGGVASRYQVYGWRERNLAEPLSEGDARLKLEGGDVALPGVRWDDLFGTTADARRAVAFRSAIAEGVRSGIRVPFSGWSGSNFTHGVLAIDLRRRMPLDPGPRGDRGHLRRPARPGVRPVPRARLGTGTGRHPLAGRAVPRAGLAAVVGADPGRRGPRRPAVEVGPSRGIRPRLCAGQAIRLEHDSPQDRSARRLGVRWCLADGRVALEVPLIHGTSRPATYRVGTGLTREEFGPQDRNEMIGDIYRTWYDFCDGALVPNGVSTYHRTNAAGDSPAIGPTVTTWDSAVDWSQTHALSAFTAN